MDLDSSKLYWLVCLLWLLGRLKSSMQATTASCSHGVVRLVNGTNRYEGRVEICLHGTWKTVCDDFWTNGGARVVCTQLGYQGDGALAVRRAHFGQGSGLILEVVLCFGHEETLTACDYHDANDGICNHGEDAGVQCLPCPTNGALRLKTDLKFQYLDNVTIQSLVEVCINGIWSAVCGDFLQWNSVATSIVCKQLGFSKYGSRPLILRHQLTDFRVHLTNIHCTGNEHRLIDCSHDYHSISQHNLCTGPAAVECQTTPDLLCREGELRLDGGNGVGNGTIEVCLNETWGTMCSESWDQMDSAVVCKQLGYSDKGAQEYQVLGPVVGNRPKHLINVQCIGNESNLYDCHREVFTSIVNCTYDVGISCTFDALLNPQNLQVTVDESNTCTLRWQAPNMIKRYGTVLNYLINCTITEDGTEITTYTNDTKQTLELSRYALYTCCVSGVNEVGAGNPACQSFITYESAPTTPPTNIEVYFLNDTSVFLSWRPPSAEYRNGIARGYDIEVVDLNTTTTFVYTTQDPNLLINNLDPDKVYMCRIAAITIGKGPYSEQVIFNRSDYYDSGLEQTSVSTCTYTEVALATSITLGVLLLFLFLSSILFIIVCVRSKICRNSQKSTRCAAQSPAYEVVDITESNLTNSKAATQEQYSQSPSPPPLPPPNDLKFKAETTHAHQEAHFTPIYTNIPTDGESTYQPLIPLRAHQMSISTEYESLRQLSKEKSCNLPPPVPPKPKC